jgi:hypothetical protein
MTARKFRFLNADSAKRAPNYGSRQMQLKLFMLIGSLAAVVWCMDQARRPETWYWLTRLNNGTVEGKGNPASVSETAGVDGMPVEASANEANQADDDSRLTTDRLTTDRLGAPNPHDPPAGLPWTLEKIYWDFALSKLSPDERFILIHAVGSWCGELNIDLPVDDPLLRSTLYRLSELRLAFDREVKSAAILDRDPWLESVPANPGEGPSAAETDSLGSEQETLGQTGAESHDDEDESQVDGSNELPGLQWPKTPIRSLFPLVGRVSLKDAQQLTDQSLWLRTYWEPWLAGQGSPSLPGVGDLREEISSDASAGEQQHPQTQSTAMFLGKTEDQELRGRAVWQRLRAELIEPFLLATIEDGSRLGRPAERAVWLRFIQQTQTAGGADAAASEKVNPVATAPPLVTRQNLMGQPEAFRGKVVRVQGTIRRIQPVSQTDTTVALYMNTNKYAVLWIQPGVTGQGPYCVYCPQSDALLALGKNNADPRRPVVIAGRFFKLHPYTNAAGKPAWCPLLIAEKVDLYTPAVPANTVTFSAGQWVVAIVIVGLVAVGLAIGGWYTTRYQSANPIGARKRNAATVQWLTGSDVESPREALQRMAAPSEPTEVTGRESPAQPPDPA